MATNSTFPTRALSLSERWGRCDDREYLARSRVVGKGLPRAIFFHGTLWAVLLTGVCATDFRNNRQRSRWFGYCLGRELQAKNRRTRFSYSPPPSEWPWNPWPSIQRRRQQPRR